MSKDEFGRILYTEQDIINALYNDPSFDFSRITLEDPHKHNDAIGKVYSELSLIQQTPNIDVTPEEWHHLNQSTWYMPDEYKQFDIAKWVLDECKNNDTELQRCAYELLEYTRRDLLPMLQYLKYLVDTMRTNNIVWGVGRGSSGASFVLYKIGVHKVNSITFDLDFTEFMKEQNG